MSGPLRVYVNERPVDLPPGADAAAAVRALDPGLADAIAAGGVLLTDGRGIPVEPHAPLAAGSILRARRTARRGGGDAHP
ncbi:MAG TPA: hypothetical protein VFU46_08385 [Gemmatimonadales bacterium]|nr:hypothetical protein [Gemmatimonadales bacterium]